MTVIAAKPEESPQRAVRCLLGCKWRPLLRRACGRRQIALFGALYLAYEVGRALTRGSLDAAVAHAHALVALEQHLGLSIERSVQNLVVHTPLPVALSAVYLAAQLVVVSGALIWTYRRHRHLYRTLRDTVIATWALALPVYALLPLAPPRLADVGLADLVTSDAHISLDSNFSTLLYNPLAAMPSLHAGFAVAVALAVFHGAPSRIIRMLGLLWAPLVAFTVVATGNHYVVDVVGGIVATAAGYGVARLLRRARQPVLAG